MPNPADAQSVNLIGILNASHENKWVALASDYSRVIAVSDSLSELMNSTINTDVVYHRVLPRGVSFAPLIIKESEV